MFLNKHLSYFRGFSLVMEKIGQHVGINTINWQSDPIKKKAPTSSTTIFILSIKFSGVFKKRI